MLKCVIMKEGYFASTDGFSKVSRFYTSNMQQRFRRRAAYPQQQLYQEHHNATHRPNSEYVDQGSGSNSSIHRAHHQIPIGWQGTVTPPHAPPSETLQCSLPTAIPAHSKARCIRLLASGAVYVDYGSVTFDGNTTFATNTAESNGGESQGTFKHT